MLSTTIAFAADLRQAARRLARSRAFAVLAIGTLTIGIGVNIAMFALLDALLFRPPSQVAQPDQVVRLLFRLSTPRRSVLVERTHFPNFSDVRASGAFETTAAFTNTSVSIGEGPGATLANAMLVSRSFFEVLRPQARIGSLVLGDAGGAEGGDGIVISYGFWRRIFAGDPRVVGAAVSVDGKPYAVAGVAPDGFQCLSPRPVDLWLPLDHASRIGSTPRAWRENRGPFWLGVIGRLRPGTSAKVAEQQASTALGGRHSEDPATPSVAVETSSIVPGRRADKPLEIKVSFWLAGVSAFVLLIACANVSNLVMARTFAQRREYFIRLTLGATRWDLVRRALSETCVIVVPGTVLAVGVAFFLRNAVVVFLSADIPLSRELLDGRTATMMAMSAALAFILVAAVSLSQLREATRVALLSGATHARSIGQITRRTLLAVQAGLCLWLLLIAGLFATSLHRATTLDLGIDVDRTIQVTLSLPATRRTPAETRALYQDALDAFARHPDVERASLTGASPYTSGNGASPWTLDHTAADLWADREVAYRSSVGAGFFAAVGAQSLRGRDFNDADRLGTQPVAVINAPLAKYLWPSRDALGECLWLDDAATCYRVVGILGGVWKLSVLKREAMALYLPLAQTPDSAPGALFIRPKGEARAFLAQARAVVQGLRPDLPAARVTVVRDIVDPELRPWRLGATVFSAFAAVALLIASIGLYGVVSVSTTLRLKEIGIRMSLGARWPHVIGVVVGEGLVSVTGGLVVGSLLAAAASRWLGGVLFETSPGDAVVLGQTALTLLVVSAVAAGVPTVRALRTDPARVLRAD